jgi:hypothetical protein
MRALTGLCGGEVAAACRARIGLERWGRRREAARSRGNHFVTGVSGPSQVFPMPAIGARIEVKRNGDR